MVEDVFKTSFHHDNLNNNFLSLLKMKIIATNPSCFDLKNSVEDSVVQAFCSQEYHIMAALCEKPTLVNKPKEKSMGKMHA